MRDTQAGTLRDTHATHACETRSQIQKATSITTIHSTNMNTLSTITMDEIVPCEIRNLQDLINAIFVDTVTHEVNKLRKEKCCGCLVDHPSQKKT